MATKSMHAAKHAAKKTGTASRAAHRLVSSPRGGRMLAIRSQLGLNRELFARMLPVSTRSLATVEAGEKPSEPVSRKLTELQRVIESLSYVIDPDAIGEWLTTPNRAFEGLKPIEVIERGEVDRIWKMIYFLESGQPG